MKKKLIGGITILVAGAATALTAAAIPSGSIPAAPEPVSGIIDRAETYATADPVAEQGLRDVIEKCMASAGFDYTPADTAPEMDLHAMIGFERLNVATAKASGYGNAVGTEPAPDSELGRLFANPAFQSALYGEPDADIQAGAEGYGTRSGGCRGEAVTKIYGSMENYGLATVVAYNSFFAATSSALSDSGVNDANKRWKSCMADTPYSAFDNPQQARDAGAKAGGQDEIKIAVTDAVCQDKTGLHDQLDIIFDKYLTTQMQQMEPQIQKVTEIRNMAAANAAKLTAVSGK